MKISLVLMFIALFLVSSCNSKIVDNNIEITGENIIEVEPIQEISNIDIEVIENITFLNNSMLIEEFEARKNIFSTENKIHEIQELLIDLEDKNRIEKDVMIESQKKLNQIRENFNLSYNYYNKKEYSKAKDLAIQTKKAAKEIIRTLDKH